MNENQIEGGFAGDPTAALAVAHTGGCCGNPPHVALVLPEPSASTSPCCGTAAEAKADGACCGTAARSDAVATGAGCCG